MASPFRLNQRIRQVRARKQTATGPQKTHLQQRLTRLRGRRNLAAPGPKEVTPLPWNAQYETTVGGLNRNYADTQANLQYQQQGINQGYGLAPGFDDPTQNPFSRAALLQRSYEQARAGTLNSYASGGQLYSGALGNAENTDRFNFVQNQSALQGQYQDAQQKLTSDRIGANRTLQEGTAQAEAQRIEDALKEPATPAEAPRDPYANARKRLVKLRAQRSKAKQPQKRSLNQRIQRLLHR